MSDPQTNRANAMAFYDLMFNQCQPRAAMERYSGDVYIQHNPHVGDGKEAFIAYFDKLAAEYPGKHVEFKRVIAEGAYVVGHTYQQWPGEADWVSIDIFRVDEQIVHRAPYAPRGPLGFIAWIDNQYAVVTPQGHFRFGLLAIDQPQTLNLEYIEIKPLT